MASDAAGADNDDVHIHAQVAMLHERTRSLSVTVDRHESSMGGIYSRLGKIERLIWIGIGGLGAVGALATFFGWNILKVLGH